MLKVEKLNTLNEKNNNSWMWCFSAKATYAAIANTYSYLTPDLWKETAFTKSPYQEFTDYLAKNFTRQPVQRQEQKVYWSIEIKA